MIRCISERSCSWMTSYAASIAARRVFVSGRARRPRSAMYSTQAVIPAMNTRGSACPTPSNLESHWYSDAPCTGEGRAASARVCRRARPCAVRRICRSSRRGNRSRAPRRQSVHAACVVHRIDINQCSHGMREANDLLHRIDRAHGVGSVANRDELRVLINLGGEVGHVERAVGVVDSSAQRTVIPRSSAIASQGETFAS